MGPRKGAPEPGDMLTEKEENDKWTNSPEQNGGLFSTQDPVGQMDCLESEASVPTARVLGTDEPSRRPTEGIELGRKKTRKNAPNSPEPAYEESVRVARNPDTKKCPHQPRALHARTWAKPGSRSVVPAGAERRGPLGPHW